MDGRKSPLKWVGSKTWLAPVLERAWARAGRPRLVEPFCGSCAVGFFLEAFDASMSDANPELINFWRHLDGAAGASAWPNDRPTFEAVRDAFNLARGAGGAEQAARFYYLNRTCYNGLWRVNRRGEFNVPFGKRVNPALQPSLAEWRDASKNWTFRAEPWPCALSRVAPGDFVYADPPYWGTFDGYVPGGFSWAEQSALAACLAEMAAGGATVVASNSAHPDIVARYAAAGFATALIPSRLNQIRPHKEQTPTVELLAWRGVEVVV